MLRVLEKFVNSMPVVDEKSKLEVEAVRGLLLSIGHILLCLVVVWPIYLGVRK